MFIARAVSTGKSYEWEPISSMPTLETDSEAFKSYMTIHGQAHYDSFQMSPEGAPEPPPHPPLDTVHSPRHDAESVYWVLSAAMLIYLLIEIISR